MKTLIKTLLKLLPVLIAPLLLNPLTLPDAAQRAYAIAALLYVFIVFYPFRHR